MVLLRISFERNQGKNTIELINETAGTTNGPIDVGEKISGDTRKLYLVSKPSGSFSGKVGIVYKSPDNSTWIFHKFLNVGSDEEVSVEYQSNHQYDGPFNENGKPVIYFLTCPTLSALYDPIPSISSRGVIKASVPVDQGTDSVHIKNISNNDTSGRWVGGYYPKISSSSDPSCFVTYHNTGYGTEIVIELFGTELSSLGYKSKFGSLISQNALVSGEVEVENVISGSEFKNKINVSIKHDASNTSTEFINTKNYVFLPNSGMDTNFACVQWNIDISNPPKSVTFKPVSIVKDIASTLDDYSSVSSSSGAGYKISSYPQQNFTSNFF